MNLSEQQMAGSREGAKTTLWEETSVGPKVLGKPDIYTLTNEARPLTSHHTPWFITNENLRTRAKARKPLKKPEKEAVIKADRMTRLGPQEPTESSKASKCGIKCL